MSKQIKMTKRKFNIDDNCNYKLVKTEVSQITREQHKMIIEIFDLPVDDQGLVEPFDGCAVFSNAIPFFRNLGGKERALKAGNPHVIRLTSTSPDRSIRVIRDFDFYQGAK